MDRPIIFSGPMITAILDGRKSMTRRLAWRYRGLAHAHDEDLIRVPTVWQKVRPGDLLWVREAFYETDKLSRIGWPDGAPTPAVYRADIPQAEWCCAVWTASVHMPRHLSRLTLEVTATRIERLQDISEDDARAEGVESSRAGQWGDGEPIKTYRTGFVRLWNELHGEGAWLDDPEVVVIGFKAHQQNIDELKARRAAKGGS